MQIRVNSSVKFNIRTSQRKRMVDVVRQRKDYINEQKAHGKKPRDGFWNIDNIYRKFK